MGSLLQRTLRYVIAGCGFALWTTVFAADVQVVPSPVAGKTIEAPLPDGTILNRLHADYVREMRAAHLAKRRSQSGQVRQLSETVYRDSVKADRQVRALAGRLGVKLAPVSKTNSAALRRLQHLQGPEFDQQFLVALERRRETSIKALEHQRFLLLKGSPMQDLLTLQLPRFRQQYDIAFHLAQGTLEVADADDVDYMSEK